MDDTPEAGDATRKKSEAARSEQQPADLRVENERRDEALRNDPAASLSDGGQALQDELEYLRGEKRRSGELLRAHEALTEDRERLLHSKSAELAERVAELERLNTEIRDSRRAALNMMEDAIQSREALRASEEKYRTLFDSIDEGFCLLELIYDGAGNAIDWHFVEVNKAYERLTGMENSSGKRGSAVTPNSESYWLENYSRVAQTGEPLRVENFHEDSGHWYRAYVSRVGGAGSRQVAIVFDDITERKLREQQQNFLLNLSDILRPLSNPADIQRAACHALGEFTGVSRVLYGDVIDEKEVVISHNYVNGVPPIVGWLNAEDFGPETIAAYKRGDKVVFSDVASDPRLTEGERRNFAAINIAASASLGLNKGGRWVAAFGMHNATPREWTPFEIKLLDETAERTWAAVERARTEQALRESEERLRLLIESATDYSIFTIDPEGIVTSWNEGARRMFGWTTDEIIGQSGDRIFTPEDRAAGAPKRERTIALERGNAPDERFHIRKDGTRFYVSGALSPLRNSTLHGFVKIARDLSERQRNEAALRDSEARLQAVANLVPDLLWSSDPGGHSDWYNDRWLEYTGQTLEEARDYGWLNAIHPDDRESSLQNFQGAMERGEPIRQEHRIRRHDGEYRWFLVQARPLRTDAGEILRWFGAATDIHEERTVREDLEQRVGERTQELSGALNALEIALIEQKQAAVERRSFQARLVASLEEERRRISRELHDDLGQHIASFGLTLRSLRSTLPPESAATEQIERMSQDINAMSQEVHRIAVDLRPTALDDLGLAPALRSYIEEWSQRTGIEAVLDDIGLGANRLPDPVETTIYRVVQEALTNVAKHGRTATIVTVTIQPLDGFLQTVIEDNGQGFDPEAAARSGRLGIVGMRERAEIVGGTLEIESSPGHGTIVYLRVPAENLPPPP